MNKWKGEKPWIKKRRGVLGNRKGGVDRDTKRSGSIKEMGKDLRTDKAIGTEVLRDRQKDAYGDRASHGCKD